MRRSVNRIGRIALGMALLPLPALADDPLPERVEFNRHIRPILSDNCFQCHGPDPNTRNAGLRLDRRTVAVAEGAIAPGEAEASELVRRVLAEDPGERMPPPESNREVTPHEAELLARWIEQGAEYQAHWAYIPPKHHPMPPVEDEAWARNPIDRFILANLESRDLVPSPEADRVTLLRRLHFDLVGLPPSPAEVAAFVNDTSENAYEKQVDRLLASEHFGERFAIQWLDLVRYADTVGYHGDQVRGVAPYRDYVIQAFNENMPFDQFTREQLAGDLLEDPTRDQLIATGYNRLNMVTREGGAQPKDYIARYASDRTRTTASVWLGSSLGCAECHDHKFDPFTAKDFYSFAAFFADVKEKGVQNDGGNEGPFPPYLLFPTDEEEQELAALRSEIARLQTLLAAPEPEKTAAAPAGKARVVLASAETPSGEDAAPPDPDKIRKRIRDLERKKLRVEGGIYRTAITETMEPRVTRVLPRGNFMDESGEVVDPAVPEFLGGMWKTGERATRLDLAEWLTDENNPLTARAFVNRLWKLYFGTGISRVLDDLGSQGEWPEHPELLDHLALEFMESGWDIKHTVKYIVMSSTYRQTSMAGEALKERDPYNRLLARQSRFRLNAELIRDNALKVSGLLSEKMGGPSVKPYQPDGYYRELNFPKREYQEDSGEDLYRRGVYTHWQRTFLHPSLTAFDAPTREECTAERTVSNSPQQALVLLNDPIYVEAARVFAERILREGGDSVRDRITWAYREALSREPLAEEYEIVASLFEKHLGQFKEDPASAKAFVGVGEKPVPDGMAPVELAAWSSVSRTLINTHEMIYRY